MKNILIAALLFTSQAFAADTVLPNNKVKLGQASSSGDKIIEFNTNSGTANPKIKVTPATNKIQFANDGLNFKDLGSGSGSGGSGISVLLEGGFESGINVGWTSSGGTYAAITSGINLIFENVTASFQASATAQFFESTSQVVPQALHGQDCMARILYKGGDANLYLTILDGASLELIPATARGTLNATTGIKTAKVYFTCPSSGSIKMRVQSTALSAVGFFDQGFLGNADFQPTKQAQFVGSVKYGLNSTSVVGSTTFQPSSAVTQGAVYNGVTPPTGTRYGLTIPSGGRGRYVIVANGFTAVADGNTPSNTTSQVSFAATDIGANDFCGFLTNGGTVTSVAEGRTGATFMCEYNATSDLVNKEFWIKHRTLPSANGSVNAFIGAEISVYYYPSGNDTVVNSKCPNDIACENNFSSYNGSTGVVSSENLDWINGNCTQVSGTYTCNFNSGVFTVAPTCQVNATLDPTFGTYTTGITAISSTGITFKVQQSGVGPITSQTILSCQKSGADFKARQNIQGFLSSTVTSNQNNVRIESAFVNNNCNASPCVITAQTGVFTSITRVGLGQYQANIQAGTFSQVISCVAMAHSANGNPTYAASDSAPSLTNATFNFRLYRRDTHGEVDERFSIICTGLR